jgi:hypothetical protein
VLLFTPPAASMADERTVAVMPFEVRAGEDYQYLKGAIPDMFASRIAQTPGSRLLSGSRIEALKIDPADMDEDSALEAGGRIGADFVLYGSLTMIEKSWSMDAGLVDVSGERLVESFFRSGSDTGELIPALESMAGEVKSYLSNIEEQGKRLAEPESGPRPEQTKPGRDAPHAGFESAEPIRTGRAGAWTGPEMEHNFTGLASGDVTGDGITETVLADSNGVYIYSLHGNGFRRLEKIDAPGNAHCIALDIGDINQNGRAEIFVTARNNARDMLRSYIIEYDKGEYRRMAKKQPWFYRVVKLPANKVPVLLGQRYRMKSDPFGADVVRLQYEEGTYVPGEVFLDSDGEINVLSLSVGQIRGRGDDAVIAALDREGRLKLLDFEGKRLWSSSEEYGGSTFYLEGPVKGLNAKSERFYLPGRTLVFEQGQSAQVFTFRNKGLPINLERTRIFDQGELVCLAWNRGRLKERWKTRSYEGHFRALALGEVDGDGRQELAGLLIEKEGATLFSDPLSKVLIFPLQDHR